MQLERGPEPELAPLQSTVLYCGVLWCNASMLPPDQHQPPTPSLHTAARPRPGHRAQLQPTRRKMQKIMSPLSFWSGQRQQLGALRYNLNFYQNNLSLLWCEAQMMHTVVMLVHRPNCEHGQTDMTKIILKMS